MRCANESALELRGVGAAVLRGVAKSRSDCWPRGTSSSLRGFSGGSFARRSRRFMSRRCCGGEAPCGGASADSRSSPGGAAPATARASVLPRTEQDPARTGGACPSRGTAEAKSNAALATTETRRKPTAAPGTPDWNGRVRMAEPAAAEALGRSEVLEILHVAGWETLFEGDGFESAVQEKETRFARTKQEVPEKVDFGWGSWEHLRILEDAETGPCPLASSVAASGSCRQRPQATAGAATAAASQTPSSSCAAVRLYDARAAGTLSAMPEWFSVGAVSGDSESAWLGAGAVANVPACLGVGLVRTAWPRAGALALVPACPGVGQVPTALAPPAVSATAATPAPVRRLGTSAASDALRSTASLPADYGWEPLARTEPTLPA
eukprot:917223-Rhodomonas_salina.3